MDLGLKMQVEMQVGGDDAIGLYKVLQEVGITPPVQEVGFFSQQYVVLDGDSVDIAVPPSGVNYVVLVGAGDDLSIEKDSGGAVEILPNVPYMSGEEVTTNVELTAIGEWAGQILMYRLD